ncbi:BPSS1187 family protein [Parvicella tangerina]|uniref:Secretion system C-terminal sorting domain-containing protein n=1 Tax=Parvicella tangerina TaxID=2829795 RepID=A0A916JNN4_9FLAO|nr:T9SS type A sorting domain-containing protein [Parvicella tangerina]CAG5082411.1 hypothetical protein CRYO30217_01907 [Parvicella tangerina]
MKTLLTSLLIVLSINESFSQNSFYVQPVLTDPSYTAAQDSHLVIRPNTTPLNKLFVFFGGTGSKTMFLQRISNKASDLGYHVINLAYPNSVPALFCSNSSDLMCFDNFREELFYGTPVSSIVSIDSLNSLNTRLKNLLNYLSVTYPSDNWNQYISQDSIHWNKIAVGGHSQGAGHAAYCAKKNNVDRVLMFSGANDFSDYYNSPANWITGSSLTDASRFYAFLNLFDEAAGFADQYQNLIGFGMTQTTDTIRVDNVSSPYNNSQCLYTTSNAQPPQTNKFHGSTVVDPRTPLDSNGNPIFDPVWDYMLTSATVLGLNETSQVNQTAAYPNPTNGLVRLKVDTQIEDNFIIDINGRHLGSLKIIDNELDISHLPNATYFVYFKLQNGEWSYCKIMKE